jgi:hypothetical protein
LVWPPCGFKVGKAGFGLRPARRLLGALGARGALALSGGLSGFFHTVPVIISVEKKSFPEFLSKAV